MTATILNAERLLAKLRRLPDAAREQIKIAMAEQADEIVDMMRRLVSVDEGDLRDSIGWRWGAKAPKGSMSVGTVNPGVGGLTITIYAGNSKAFHARWIEFGTVKMGSRPFFFPSWRAGRKSAKNKVRAAIRKAAKQVASAG